MTTQTQHNAYAVPPNYPLNPLLDLTKNSSSSQNVDIGSSKIYMLAKEEIGTSCKNEISQYLASIMIMVN